MKRKTIKPRSINAIKRPKKEGDLPVTKRLLDLKIQEVKGDISGLRLEIKAGFAKMDARFLAQDAKFLAQDARFAEADARFESMQAQLAKMMVIIEEQNDRNRVALDGYMAVYEKFQDTGKRLGHLEKSLFGNRQR